MKRKDTKINASRFIIIALSIIAQAVGIWVLVFILNRRFAVAQIITTVIGVILFLSIVNREQAAVYKVPWILIFLIFPFAGVMIYVTFGNVRMSKKQMKKFRQIYDEKHDAYYAQTDAMKRLSEAGQTGLGMVKYLKSATSLPVFANSTVSYLPTGEEFYKKLKSELYKAERYVFLEYFIIDEGVMWEGIYDILIEKITKGVKVYLMYDDVGSMARLPSQFYKELQQKGLNAKKFNTFRPVVSISHNNRDHRKIAVVDGVAGFVSGANIADEYINVTHPFGEWRDNGVFIKGQAVDSLVRLFIQLYNMSSGESLIEEQFIFDHHEIYNDGFLYPFGDSPAPITTEHISENLYLDIINRADKYLYITTPYLIVDTNITDALKKAAKRGVDVRIIIPEVPDKKLIYILTRSFCPSLMAAGVKMYRFTEGFIHSKTFLSDGEVGVVGTVNLDYRSLVHHFECAVWMYKNEALNDI
ncbi:MAG: cardiolipin synthase, partial [Clostridia bacterium]|nr:cardiolipin synthase [Clostridia bacterium]